MAFQIEILSGTAIYNLSAGTPFKVERAEGLGLAPVRRLTERGPYQDGQTDLGYRLDPRTITMPINFKAESGSALDIYRDLLAQVFKPRSSEPIRLRITRDDGEMRQIDCHTIGMADVPLERQNRPGNLHRSVVQLQASDPAFYSPIPQSGTLGTAGMGDWYLGNNTISPEDVLEYVENPAQGQASSYGGTPYSNPSNFSITFAFRSDYVATNYPGGTTPHAFGWSGTPQIVNHFFSAGGTGDIFYRSASLALGTAAMLPGTHNYMVRIASERYNTQFTVFRDGTVPIIEPSPALVASFLLGGTADRRWRSNVEGAGTTFWPVPIPKAAVYKIALDNNQLRNLSLAMDGTATETEYIALGYEGDWPSFPIITVRGPISNPIITNVTTGEILSFPGVTLGADDFYTIDLRYGNKTIYSGTANKIGELSSDSDLATWHLEPAPGATGGTNVISIAGTAVGAAAETVIYYTNRYISF